MEETFHIGGSDSEHDEIDVQYGKDENSISVPALEEAIDPVQAFIGRKLREHGCSRTEMSQIRLAVEEIFVNICSYAYRPKTDLSRILCEVMDEDSCVSIQFSDTGIPFNPVERPEADTSEEAFVASPGGYGIHLVKHLMDDVVYSYENGKNILKIRKNV